MKRVQTKRRSDHTMSEERIKPGSLFSREVNSCVCGREGGGG